MSAIGNVGAFLERDEFVGAARVYDTDIVEILFYEFAKAKCNVQIDRLFVGFDTQSAVILSPVSGIDNEDEFFALSIHRGIGKRQSCHHEKYYM